MSRKQNGLIGKFIRMNDQFHNEILGHRCFYGMRNVFSQNQFPAFGIMDQLYEYYYNLQPTGDWSE